MTKLRNSNPQLVLSGFDALHLPALGFYRHYQLHVETIPDIADTGNWRRRNVPMSALLGFTCAGHFLANEHGIRSMLLVFVKNRKLYKTLRMYRYYEET